MTRKSPGHPHQFSIADPEAVRVLLSKLEHPQGSSAIDAARLADALEDATRQFMLADERERQAFFHGLLTGYAVGLKCGAVRNTPDEPE